MFGLDGATVLVTGASGGIGGATVRQLVAAGAEVIAGGRSVDALDRLKASTGCRTLPFDLESEDSIRGAVESGVLTSGIMHACVVKGVDYVLRAENAPQDDWIGRLLAPRPPAYSFRLAERDESGARALSELRDRGINLAADALAQSADHVLSFFMMLRTELAFYVGCLNLRAVLRAHGGTACFPRPAIAAERRLSAAGLYDACLALQTAHAVVGNEVSADGKDLVIVTGANQGGKSTFLRSIGLAHLMMQCGMFVAAGAFQASVCERVFTHYKREEDATMSSGKFDEELGRMSAIIDAVVPGSLILFNESFAATNEREGSEIARQIVAALIERQVRVFFVTHQYEFAHGFYERGLANALFLRAEREASGTRTFRIAGGEPLQTSHGEDLYKRIFADAAAT